MPSASSSSRVHAACSPGNCVECIGAQLCQIRRADLANREQRVLLARIPASFHSTLIHGGLPSTRSNPPRRANTSAKAQLPVHEPPTGRNRLDLRHSREMLPKPADAQLTEPVVQVGLRGRRRQPELRRRSRPESAAASEPAARSRALARSRSAPAAPHRRCCLRARRRPPSTIARGWADRRSSGSARTRARTSSPSPA